MDSASDCHIDSQSIAAEDDSGLGFQWRHSPRFHALSTRDWRHVRGDFVRYAGALGILLLWEVDDSHGADLHPTRVAAPKVVPLFVAQRVPDSEGPVGFRWQQRARVVRSALVTEGAGRHHLVLPD